ncbi:Purine nucleoside phosphorylase [Oopsacas minuta]|uniref:Purine nucleoside phosphorylase n=1 Tax=Oopsacas minuta TaxID=111878 RepID=A0AAV7KL91_9METZ|nr:Purine nucleoside phosphorylase [Oopsacas minuta]
MNYLHTLRILTALTGLSVSLYTAYIYRQKLYNPDYKALCDISETISCSDAIRSRYSKGFGLLDGILDSDSILNIPNFILGIIFFILYSLVTVTEYFTFLLLPAATISVCISIYLFYILNLVMKIHCLLMSQGVKRRRSTRLSSSGYYSKRTKPTQCPTNILSVENFQEMADYVKEKISVKPEVGIICGSGLGTLSDLVKDSIDILYEEVPHMPVSTVEGHEGKFVIGSLGGMDVICMKGRVHHYEGYHSQQLTAPIRLMSRLGVKYLVVTNAAGGVNKSFSPGDLMLIKDHINFLGLAGINPLIGPNLSTFGTGERFLQMVNCYDKEMRETALELAPKHGVSLQQGVYALIGGPSFETPAEIKFLNLIGVDAVGMSTAPEVIVARHCGIRTVAFSLITNMSVHPDSVHDESTSHSAVLALGSEVTGKFSGFITELVSSFKSKGMPLQPEADVFHDTLMESCNNDVMSKTVNNNTELSSTTTPADDNSMQDNH